MKNQTVRRPENKRQARSNKPKTYNKQTARFEGKRDGKPLILGWGGHLSHNQKVQLQKRATWAMAIAVALVIIIVLVSFWININVIIPGLPITSVNGQKIPQSLYREMVAFKTELALNDLNGTHGLIAQRNNLRTQISAQQKTVSNTTKQIDNLTKQIAALPHGPSTQRTNLNSQLTAAKAQLNIEQAQLATLNQNFTTLTSNTLPQAQTNFNQSQVGNDSVSWLQDDVLISDWLATQSNTLQAEINPSASALNRALNDFKNNLPKGQSYSSFLSSDGVSDDNIQAMMTVKLRRDNMQTYQASLVVSPAYQVLARAMTIDTQDNAKKILNQLKHGGNFGKLASTNSVDANTSKNGGSLNWLVRGQYAQSYQAAGVENWIFDPARKLNELSPVLFDNGAYHIVQIMSVDPSRVVDAATLKTLKTYALSDWLLEQHALPTTKITPTNQDMLLDPMNIPSNLPLAAPASTPSIPGLP